MSSNSVVLSNNLSDSQMSNKANNLKLPRKRNRIPVACSICRKRKVKCDRARPHCEVCQRYNVAHLCSYQEPSWTQNSFTGSSEKPRSPLCSSNDPDVSSDLNADNIFKKSKSDKTFTLDRLKPVHTSNDGTSLTQGPHRFDNNINSLINHSSVPTRDPLGFDEHSAHFKNYRDICPPQSNERSTANIPVASPKSTPGEVGSRLTLMYRDDRISEAVNDAVSPAIQSELERMKQKIKEIEASITLSKTFNVSILHHPRDPPAIVNPILQCGDNGNKYTYQPTKQTCNKTSPLSASSVSSNEFGRSSNNLSEPYIVPTDVIDFYADYISVSVRQSKLSNHGPLTWLTILKRDRFLKIIWVKVIEVKKKNSIFPQNVLKRKLDDGKQEKDVETINIIKPTTELEIQLEKEFREKALDQEGFNDIQPLHPVEKNPVLVKRLTPFTSPESYNNISELALINLIEDNLPTKKVIWLCLDRFFKYCYPLFPCVDQEMFLEDISKIIGPRDLLDAHITKIAVGKRLDFAMIGQLLLFIRAGYLTVTSNNDQCKFTDDCAKFLIRNPVGPQVALIAQSCLNQFHLMRSTSISIFQLALFMRMYHWYAPEGGDITQGEGSLVFGGLLTQMGLSLGLNRDPSSFGINSKMVGLWRKLWAVILLNDSKNTNALGSTSYIRNEHFDTQPPTFVDDMYSNHLDLEIEKISIEILNQSIRWNSKLKEVTDIVSKFKNPPQLIVVIDKLKEIELFISREFGNLSKIMTLNNNNHIENIAKTRKISSYLEIQTTVQVIYHFIFLHLEEKKNYQAAAYFLKKNLSIISEIMFNFGSLLRDLYRYVGEGFDTYLTPKVELAMHRTIQIQLGLFVRLQHLKCVATLHDSLSLELNLALDRFCEIILKSFERYLNGLSGLRSRQYFAWKMLRQQALVSYILKKHQNTLFEKGKDMQINIKVEDSSIIAPSCNVFLGLSVLDIEELGKVLNPQHFEPNFPIENKGVALDVSVNSDTDVDNIWNQDIFQSMGQISEFDERYFNESQTNFDTIFGEEFDFDIFNTEYAPSITF